MEVEGENGSKIVLQNVGDKVVFGRGFGFNTKDKTVSRRHVVFELAKSGDSQTGSKVSFEVVGKNPMWAREHGNGEIWVFRKGEKGDVAEGDWLCFLSRKRPVWFVVRESGSGERKKRVLESEIGLGESLGSRFKFDNGVDVEALDIDPVKASKLQSSPEVVLSSSSTPVQSSEPSQPSSLSSTSTAAAVEDLAVAMRDGGEGECS